MFVSSKGERMDIKSVLKDELLRGERNGEQGDVGVLVCGPNGMADEVRGVIGEVVGGGVARKRNVLFIDEGFSW